MADLKGYAPCRRPSSGSVFLGEEDLGSDIRDPNLILQGSGHSWDLDPGIGIGSGIRVSENREIRDGDGNQDLGFWGLGSWDPGTGIWVSEVSGDWDLGAGKARRPDS